jgi:2-polyprenyl-6-hydroxyphenyl methylase/3-demethylubiquinone-9 3-methyltransferase
MTRYYAEKLSGVRLQRCYEVASPRVRQYLEAEIQQVLRRLRPTDLVLELGCGYGRVALRLAEVARRVVGIDVARESLLLARELAGSEPRCEFALMDAVALAFADRRFDAVVCVQNGICAFGCDPRTLVAEALRVCRPGGIVLLATYSDRFWPERLGWFEAQAAAGLIGAVDHAASGDGVIVCAGGFRAGRLVPDALRALCRGVGVEPKIGEVDGSSVFCEMVRPRVFDYPGSQP